MSDFPLNRKWTRRETLGLMAAGALPWRGMLATPESESEYEKCAREAVRWIQSYGVTTGAGKTWPGTPGQKESIAFDLYSGVAGIALILAEGARRWNSKEMAEDARLAGKEMLSWTRPMLEGRFLGLYTGLAGCIWTLDAIGKIGGVREDGWKREAAADLPLVYATDVSEKGGPIPGNDVISGLAGIGLAFLDKPLAKEPELFEGAAAGIGDVLIERGIPDGAGLRWAMEQGNPRNLPNFSHGTAGVAFFLARLFSATKQKHFLEAAVKGATYLQSVAKTDGDGCLIFHSDPGGLSRYYYGWCHGPAGTSQLFWQLHKATGDSKWKEWAVKGAKSLLDAEVPSKRAEGYWNNEGLCCGTAGIGRFFLDTYRRTGESKYFEAAEQCAKVVLENAVRDKQGARWIHAEHRVKPDELVAQSGWMQGAAGIAGFLLEMTSPRKAVIRLPVDGE